MFKELNRNAKLIEQETQEDINKSVRDHQNIIVRAGAGSGKTYSLIELLRNLTIKNNDLFSYTNQKIMCITYTNAATDEIKRRLGDTDIVAVSTIHERIWDIIKFYQEELRIIHFEKIEEIFNDLDNKLNENDFYKEYKESPNLKAYFEFIVEDKEYFYDIINQSSAANLHTTVEEYFDKKQLNRNSVKFKDMSRTYLNYRKYKVFIEDKEQRMKDSIEYNYLLTNDNLLKLEISHDTVLEYGLKLVQLNPIFKKIVIDRFPIVIIDEYQDTASEVLELISELDAYAKKNNLSFTVALFGDKLQRIYDNRYSLGVLEFLDSDNFKLIDKQFNYRSSTQIINIGNNIRDDGIVQNSPFEDSDHSLPSYEKTDSENFIINLDALKEEWNITLDNKLTCLFLRNSDIAKHMGIEDIYNSINQMKCYSGLNYNLMSQETLNKDTNELGKAQTLLLDILSLYVEINNNEIYLTDILPSAVLKKMTIQKANDYILDLKNAFSVKVETFEDYLNVFYNFFTQYREDDVLAEIFNNYNHSELFSVGEFKNKIRELFEEDDDEESRNKINRLFNINIEEYINLYNYLFSEETQREIEFLTYHSAKGLEFPNVLLIMTNDMSRRKDFFKFYLQNMTSKDTISPDDLKNKYEPARNLFYVAVTRATKNLRVWYMDDLELVEENLETIFNVE